MGVPVLPPPPRGRRRGVRALAVAVAGGLAAAVLPALPAQAVIQTPGPNATVAGLVPVHESGATNSCNFTHSPAVSARLQVTRVSDGAVVHTASRTGTGQLTSTWDSLGQPRGLFRVESWTRNANSSGFASLGCTLQAEAQRSNHLVTLDNRATVDVQLPASVVTGEDLVVGIRTTHASPGVQGRPLGNREVTVTVPEVGTVELTTDAQGRGSATVDLPDLPRGALTVGADVATDAFYTGLSGAATTTLAGRTTRTYYRGDTRVQPGGTARLEAQLVDITPGSDRFGAPIADQPLALSFDGDAADVMTTASGRAVRSVPVTGPSRTLPVRAAYGGDAVHLPSEDAVTFFVGDDASEPAPVAHGPVQGLTSLVGGLLGGVLGGTSGGGATTPAPLSLGDLIAVLTGGSGPLDDLVQALDSGLIRFLDATGLTTALDELLEESLSGLGRSGGPVDDVLDTVLTGLGAGTPLGDLIEVTGFRWRSVVVEPDGRRTAKEFGARVGLPEPLDVTGDGTPDVLANVTLVSEALALGYSGARNGVDAALDLAGDPSAIVPRVEIARLPGAPAHLPLSLQAVLTLPGDEQQYRFGYDTRTSDAPRGFRADVLLGDGGAGLQVSSHGEDALTVTGALVPRSAPAERPTGQVAPEETRFGVSFDHAPRSARLGLDLAQGGSQDVAATLTTERPTTVGLSLVDDSGADRLFSASAEFDKVDGDAAFHLAGDSDSGLQARLTSDHGLESVQVRGQQLDAGRTTTDLLLGLTDAPSRLDFGLGADGQGSLTASAPVSVFEAGYGQNRVIETLDDPAYLHLLSEQDSQSVALRLPGFEGMSLDIGQGTGNIGLELTMEPTPLRALVRQDGLELDARVLDAPRTIGLSLGESGAMTVEGSAPIELITVDAFDADGIFSGATDLSLRLEDVPSSLEIGVAGESVRFDTGDQAIGLMELSAHDGTPPALPDTDDDGLVVRQSPTGMALVARITGLRTVEAALSATPEILLDTVAGKVFTILLQQVDGSGTASDSVRATIDHLVPDLRLALQDDGSGALALRYRASEPTKSLTFDFGGVSGSIADPLPARLDVCMAGDEACLPDLGIADPDLGSIRFAASEHTTLNLVEPGSGMNVQDLRVRLLELTGSLDIDDGGDVYLNTTSFEGTCGFEGCRYPIEGGQVRADLGSARLLFAPGNGFVAVDAITNLRVNKLFGQPVGVTGVSGTGIVGCVPATRLDVTLRVPLLGDITLGLRDAICDVPRTPREEPTAAPEPEAVAEAPGTVAEAPAAPAAPEASEAPAAATEAPEAATEDLEAVTED